MAAAFGKRLLCLALLAFTARPGFAGQVHLSVAASLTDAVNEIVESYQKIHPHVKLLANHGGSGALAKQIENGAPADVFISANLEWMEYLRANGRVAPESIGAFAYNTLVFVGADNGKAATMQDLPRLERVAIGSPKSVPAGQYAVRALENAGIAGRMEGKLVMARDVRECLVYAERGEVDGAFVYRTDALQARHAKVLFVVPKELYPRVTYPMALTVAGSRSADAVAFFRYLRGETARAILARYGFSLE
jgi:molybdate transport system substrate-binding protein